jgi:hypothetical protein
MTRARGDRPVPVQTLFALIKERNNLVRDRVDGSRWIRVGGAREGQ